MQLTDVLQGLGRPVAYYPALRRLCGSVTAVILFDQLLYWSGRGTDPEGWVYKTSWDLEIETGLTQEEQQTARNKLRSRELLKEVRRGIPAKIYYRLEFEKINKLWAEFADNSWEDYVLSKKTAAKAKRQDKIQNSEKYPQIMVIPQTCLGDSHQLEKGIHSNLFFEIPQTTSLDYAYQYQRTTTQQVGSIAHPDLFKRCWRNMEPELAAAAKQFGPEEVYRLADQIDFQKSREKSSKVRQNSPLGLLLMHFRGQLSGGYSPWEGYTSDWRQKEMQATEAAAEKQAQKKELAQQLAESSRKQEDKALELDTYFSELTLEMKEAVQAEALGRVQKLYAGADEPSLIDIRDVVTDLIAGTWGSRTESEVGIKYA